MNTMCLFGYAPREPVISVLMRISRLLKTDCYGGTTYIRLCLMTHK